MSYPASVIAVRQASVTSFSISNTTMPSVWLGAALITPSSASHTFLTLASQCGHIIPSTLIVTIIVLFSSSIDVNFSFLSVFSGFSVITGSICGGSSDPECNAQRSRSRISFHCLPRGLSSRNASRPFFPTTSQTGAVCRSYMPQIADGS